ncbi:MAG TPA: D-2-hydroxyacid dehydrogenase family protein [Burkholderiaceae bacterium]|jgi:D-3-phosphoglycerate dehydrogenase
MKIAILDDYQDAVRKLKCFDLLQNHEVKIFNNSARGIGQLAIRLADFDALVLIRERTAITRPLLAKLPKLKLIAQTGKVAGHIDVAAATAAGVAIAEGVGDPTAPAELTWALIMAALRKVPQYSANLKQGTWQTASLNPTHNGLGRTLKGTTLGIWGYGKIGRLVAGYGRAFGMRVMIWGREASLALAVQDGFEIATSRETFFADADVLTLHLRLNDATRGILTVQDLASMKSDALLVNTSRAELIAPGALLAGLQGGRPGYAALDVFESEPLAPDAALLRLDNVLATPHLGYVSIDSYELYFRAAFENILSFAAGRPSAILNPDALEDATRAVKD